MREGADVRLGTALASEEDARVCEGRKRVNLGLQLFGPGCKREAAIARSHMGFLASAYVVGLIWEGLLSGIIGLGWNVGTFHGCLGLGGGLP